jgi:plasmid stabilization system protein ParE
VWPVRFTEAARAELIDAQDWYEAEAPGLGRRLCAEIDSVVGRIADNPQQFPTVFKTLRRARARRLHSSFLIRGARLSGAQTVMVESFRGAAQDARITIRAGRLLLIGTALPAIDATT